MIVTLNVVASVANSTKTGSSNNVPGTLCRPTSPRRIVRRPRNRCRTNMYALPMATAAEASATDPDTMTLFVRPLPRSTVDQMRR